jgi:DNA modification methylase
MTSRGDESTHKNTLYYGDNLDVLRRYIKDESIDLIYLDPPFKSNQDYNVLFAERDGTKSRAQIKAFEDTWSWDHEAASAYQELVERGGKPSQAMQAFRTLLGENDMLAYLSMMGLRLVELHRVLKSIGSIYLHCDPTASHYLKVLLDAVFGPRRFRNEIMWHYRRWTAPSNRFQKLHDVILFYTKSSDYTFNQLQYTPGSVERKEQGVLHRFKRGDAPVFVSDREVQAGGVAENDVWHIPFVAPSARERLGYPTQKPAALLERIIKASSNTGDVVLDPFCGCGTAVAVAEKLKRHWIGIDVTHLAIGLIKHRLLAGSGLLEKKDYRVIGEPEDLEGAMQLAKDDPYQFQSWALGKLGARQAGEIKKGADKGIDGRLYFHDDIKTARTKQ